MFREKAQIATLALLLAGAPAVGTQATKDNRLEPIPPLPPLLTDTQRIIDYSANLTCDVPSDSPFLDCHVTTPGLFRLDLTVAKEISEGKDNIAIIAASPKIEQTFEIFGEQFPLSIQLERIQYTTTREDGGINWTTIPVHDFITEDGAAEFFGIDELPNTVTGLDKNNTPIGSHQIKRSVEIIRDLYEEQMVAEDVVEEETTESNDIFVEYNHTSPKNIQNS